MKTEDKKKAEEILKPYLFSAEELGADYTLRGIEFISKGRCIEAMEEYHQFRMKEVTDEMIEKAAKETNFKFPNWLKKRNKKRTKEYKGLNH